MEIGVWPKVVLQAFFTAGQVWRRPQPLQIKSVELNWVKPRTSHEPNWLNWVRLMWSTAFGLDLILVVCFGKVEMRLRKRLGICRPSSIFGAATKVSLCLHEQNNLGIICHVGIALRIHRNVYWLIWYFFFCKGRAKETALPVKSIKKASLTASCESEHEKSPKKMSVMVCLSLNAFTL